jgi:hypothetical protein
MSLRSPSSVPHPGGLRIESGQLSAADVSGDSFPNTGRTYVIYENSSGGSLDASVDAPAVDNFGFSGNALDVTLTIPAGQTKLFGPFPENRHNDANRRVQVTYPGGVTGLKIAVLAL